MWRTRLSPFSDCINRSQVLFPYWHELVKWSQNGKYSWHKSNISLNIIFKLKLWVSLFSLNNIKSSITFLLLTYPHVFVNYFQQEFCQYYFFIGQAFDNLTTYLRIRNGLWSISIPDRAVPAGKCVGHLNE